MVALAAAKVRDHLLPFCRAQFSVQSHSGAAQITSTKPHVLNSRSAPSDYEMWASSVLLTLRLLFIVITKISVKRYGW